jgi:hypothetical protein
METAKYAVWVVWIGGAAAILFGGGGVATVGHIVVWVTLAAHVVEFFAVRSMFKRAGGPMRHHFVQTIIYGLFYWMPIKKRHDAAAQT